MLALIHCGARVFQIEQLLSSAAKRGFLLAARVERGLRPGYACAAGE